MTMMGMFYVDPSGSAVSPVRRIRAGLAPPEPRLALFTISIVVMSALGTMTMTMPMMSIYVGAEKSCAQSTRARG